MSWGSGDKFTTFSGVGGVEEWRIKLTSVKVEVEVEVEAEFGNTLEQADYFEF